MSASASSTIKIKDNLIFSNDSEKLLVVTAETKQNFNNYLDKILRKSNQKVHVLAGITPSTSIPKGKLLMSSLFISQFNYCPLVWMCHSRLINNKTNCLYEKCLRVVYSYKTSSFKELLEKEGSVTIHIRNWQIIATKMCRVYKDLSTTIATN